MALTIMDECHILIILDDQSNITSEPLNKGQGDIIIMQHPIVPRYFIKNFTSAKPFGFQQTFFPRQTRSIDFIYQKNYNNISVSLLFKIVSVQLQWYILYNLCCLLRFALPLSIENLTQEGNEDTEWLPLYVQCQVLSLKFCKLGYFVFAIWSFQTNSPRIELPRSD